MRVTWRGYVVLIAGVAVLLLAGTAAGHNRRTDIRQGGVVVAWVYGGGPTPRTWSYCDYDTFDNDTFAYEGGDWQRLNPGISGRLYVDGRLNRGRTHDNLGWAVQVGTNRWKVWANPALTGHRPRRKRHPPEFNPLEHRPYCATAPLR